MSTLARVARCRVPRARSRRAASTSSSHRSGASLGSGGERAGSGSMPRRYPAVNHRCTYASRCARRACTPKRSSASITTTVNTVSVPSRSSWLIGSPSCARVVRRVVAQHVPDRGVEQPHAVRRVGTSACPGANGWRVAFVVRTHHVEQHLAGLREPPAGVRDELHRVREHLRRRRRRCSSSAATRRTARSRCARRTRGRTRWPSAQQLATRPTRGSGTGVLEVRAHRRDLLGSGGNRRWCAMSRCTRYCGSSMPCDAHEVGDDRVGDRIAAATRIASR